MWPFKRRRSRSRLPVYDPAEHAARLAAADRRLVAAKREGAALRNMPPPVHAWQNLQLGPQLAIIAKPPEATKSWGWQEPVVLGTFTWPSYTYEPYRRGGANTGNPIHDEALRKARGF